MLQEEYYGEYLPKLEQSMDQVLDELARIMQKITTDPEQAPFEHLINRIKNAESAKGKLIKRGFQDDVESALKNLTDIIGIRIVTHFVGDIYDILDEINKNDTWTVELVKDYIAAPKENGYRSLHVILRVPFEPGKVDSIGVEVQLRTIAMDCWAALEHQMRYKKQVPNTSLIFAELKRCSDEMASTDLTMQTLRDLLMDYGARSPGT